MKPWILALLTCLPGTLAAQQDSVVGEVFLFEEIETKPRLRPGSVLYYPKESEAAGVVAAVVVVTTDGRIDPASIKIVKSPAPAFTAAARAMLIGQTYSPGKLKGQPVKVLMQQDIRFRPGTVSCTTIVTYEATQLCADSTAARK